VQLLASDAEDAAAAKALLKYKADAEATDEDGNTPFIVTVGAGHVDDDPLETMDALLEHVVEGMPCYED
jgi:ankyrin repeat protein